MEFLSTHACVDFGSGRIGGCVCGFSSFHVLWHFLVLQSVHSVFGPFKTFMLVVLVKETSAQMSRARFFPTEHCNLKANSLIHFTIQFDLESDSFIIYDTNFILVI